MFCSDTVKISDRPQRDAWSNKAAGSSWFIASSHLQSHLKGIQIGIANFFRVEVSRWKWNAGHRWKHQESLWQESSYFEFDRPNRWFCRKNQYLHIISAHNRRSISHRSIFSTNVLPGHHLQQVKITCFVPSAWVNLSFGVLLLSAFLCLSRTSLSRDLWNQPKLLFTRWVWENSVEWNRLIDDLCWL